jgi:hypothetical protein
LNELTRLVPPPPDPPPPGAWALDLPADYRELIARYGPGTLAGLGLLVPGHPNEFVDLVRQTERQRWALQYLIDQGIELPYAPADLLPWGIDEAGNVVWWLTQGDWPVVANEARGEGWHRYEGTATSFLVDVLSGAFESDFLVIEGDDFLPS